MFFLNGGHVATIYKVYALDQLQEDEDPQYTRYFKEKVHAYRYATALLKRNHDANVEEIMYHIEPKFSELVT